MPAPAITTTNVEWGIADLWLAAASTAAPADTVVFGGDWGSPWTYVGATSDGVHRSFSRNINDIRVEEQSTPVGQAVDSSQYEVTINFAEELIANVKYAYGGGTLTTVVGPPAKKTLALSDTLDQLAMGFDALTVGGKTWRVYVPIVLSVGTVGTDYRRAQGPRVYPATFRAICAINQIVETQFT